MSHFKIDPQKVLHLWKEEEKKKPNIDREYLVTMKVDGWYSFIDHSIDKGWSFPANESRVIPSFQWTKEWFERLPKIEADFRLIMEAYIPNTPFHILNGIFNRKTEDAREVHYIIHDILLINDFSKNNHFRYRLLEHFQLPYSVNEDRISIAPLLALTSDKRIWMQKFEEVTAKGGEGVILKAADGHYMPGKRNSSLMKIKCEEEYDLLAIDYFKTVGEKGHDAWNLLLEDSKGITQTVRVGKDSDIFEFSKNSPVGKVHQIKCMKRLPDGSFREPVYQGPRYDKNIKDID